MSIPTPSSTEMKFYLKQWDGLENYVLQENSLRKLFTATYPRNDCIEDILIKVCSLNDFYSTNIFSPFMVAKHILALQIDSKLKNNNLSLVNEIAEIEMSGGKKKNFYSFATKYCSHHKPEEYPIYDSYVEKMLTYFKKADGFCRFDKNELKQYIRYKDILIAFQNYYNLTQYTLKQIDKYLWQAGKKYSPKKYK
jgi:hypothetical protein